MARDIEKQKLRQREHYERNKEVYAKRSKEARKRKREILENHMTPCVECGFFHHAAMDFHHVDPSTKVGEISVLVKTRGMQVLLDELAKCVCLCANCHRIHHAPY